MVRIAVRTITLNCLKGVSFGVWCWWSSQWQKHHCVHEPAQHVEVLQEACVLRDFLGGDHEQDDWLWVRVNGIDEWIGITLVWGRSAITLSTSCISCRMCWTSRWNVWMRSWRRSWWRTLWSPIAIISWSCRWKGSPFLLLYVFMNEVSWILLNSLHISSYSFITHRNTCKSALPSSCSPPSSTPSKKYPFFIHLCYIPSFHPDLQKYILSLFFPDPNPAHASESYPMENSMVNNSLPRKTSTST